MKNKKVNNKDIVIFEDFAAAEGKVDGYGRKELDKAEGIFEQRSAILEQSVDLSCYNKKSTNINAIKELMGKALQLRILDVIDILFGQRYTIAFVQRYIEHKYQLSSALANGLIKFWAKHQEVQGVQDRKLKRIVLEKKLEEAMYDAMKRGLLKEELMAMALYAKVAGLSLPQDKEDVSDGYKDIKVTIPGMGELNIQNTVSNDRDVVIFAKAEVPLDPKETASIAQLMAEVPIVTKNN